MSNKKILVLSDIHGNREALEAIERRMKRKKIIIEKIVCLGDTLGYGVDGEWCLEWLVKRNAIILRGNHESLLIGESSDEQCSKLAKASTRWHREYIGPKVIEQIKQMKFHYLEDNMLFTHAGNKDVLSWRYINTLKDATKSFENPVEINFFGHTHRACIIDDQGNKWQLPRAEKVFLKRKGIYYINPGSVGQNREKVTKASFMIIALNESWIEIDYEQVRYKDYKAYKKIRQMKIEKEVGDYLIREKWKKKLYHRVYEFKISKFKMRG